MDYNPPPNITSQMLFLEICKILISLCGQGGEREREGDEGTEDFTGKKAAML